MRGSVAGLRTPVSIGELLPGLLRDPSLGDFLPRFTRGLDQVLAPILSTMDCFDSYLDPMLAPDDFVDWLAGWVAVEVDQTWPASRRRSAVAQALARHRLRGTAAGLVSHVELMTGYRVELAESGGAAYARRPGGPLPGSPTPLLVIRVRTANPDQVDRRRLERAVAEVCPAHLPYRIELVPPIPGPDTGQAGEYTDGQAR
ncbi:phage tail protein [Amycolatopsis taiwanensis]|uniref:Phage tail protein n=1 Tax=Amycolatopsis taiwanensis TaxID=342230 RepID=A0A9W6R7V4_9PSEU|nr:phage tail protein [Amycolatopsis taiwanensis]GLY69055.1 phage tail protein [Amycolatopsis taiwanensis]